MTATSSIFGARVRSLKDAALENLLAGAAARRGPLFCLALHSRRYLAAPVTELGALFESANRSCSLAPRITLPIFDSGRNQAALDLAGMWRDTALAN